MSATLHLVGVGPGDPELMTLKAARIIADANVVAYPEGAGAPGMALRIAGAHIRAQTLRLPVAIPMATDPRAAGRAYDTAAEAIAAHLGAGRSVAYLCEGDPLFYGSAIALLDRLAATSPVEIVPGVTSLTAAAAAAHLPLAKRDSAISILPATLPDAALQTQLAGDAMVALIKIGRHFDRVREALARAGRAEKAVVVEYATHERETITRLADFASDSRPYFSIILSPGPRS